MTNAALVLLSALGTYGAVWISDDYDPWRFVILTYGGIPLLAVYLTLEWLSPGWIRRFSPLRRTMIAGIAVAFATGFLPLVNAVTAEDSVVKRSFGDQPYVTSIRDFRRGGLGGLHRRRW